MNDETIIAVEDAEPISDLQLLMLKHVGAKLTGWNYLRGRKCTRITPRRYYFYDQDVPTLIFKFKDGTEKAYYVDLSKSSLSPMELETILNDLT